MLLSAIGEELAFEDFQISSSASDGGSGPGPFLSTRSQLSADGALSIPTLSRPLRTPSSPGGSLGSSSAVSRGSEAARSVKSMRSMKSH